MQDLASEEAIQAIQTCPVIMEEELCFQVSPCLQFSYSKYG